MATLSGANIVAEFYRIHGLVKVLLFNYTDHFLQDIYLLVEDHEIAFGSIDSLKATAKGILLKDPPRHAKIRYQGAGLEKVELDLKLL